MQALSRIICRNPNPRSAFCNIPNFLNRLTNPRNFSSGGDGGGFGWDEKWSTGVTKDQFEGQQSSWSTGLTKDQFDGEAVGQKVTPDRPSGGRGGGGDLVTRQLAEMERESRRHNEMLEGWEEEDREVNLLLKQIEEPGARGSYLKDSEKAEMYKKHKENPEVYTIEKLAQEYRIMRQRVMAILWLKEDEEEVQKQRGQPLDDSVELLLDTCPEFFNYHDREYHVATLPYKPDFKVMPEGWDGTTRDPDEVHYEISKKEDDILFEEFTQRFNFNKMKFKKLVKVHKYSRRRPSDGWDFVVTKVGARGKRGSGGGWKFVSQPNGSTRPLNEVEKMYVKRETPRRRKKILP